MSGSSGKGFARSLIAAVEQWAAKRGLGHVRIGAGVANQGSRAFHQWLG